VPPRLQTSHRPDGKMANTLASTLACTTAADPPVNYRGYVPQKPRSFPSPQWEIADVLAPTHACCFGQLQGVCATETFNYPIAPMGKFLTSCPDSRLHNYERFGQLQYVRATETLKISHLPIAPMGKLLTHFLLDSRLHNCECFGQLQGVLATEALKLPSPPWETHVLLVVCRAAVFLSIPLMEAQCQS
jgi:hypothetical protein